jgi:hypothetical protein
VNRFAVPDFTSLLNLTSPLTPSLSHPPVRHLNPIYIIPCAPYLSTKSDLCFIGLAVKATHRDLAQLYTTSEARSVIPEDGHNLLLILSSGGRSIDLLLSSSRVRFDSGGMFLSSVDSIYHFALERCGGLIYFLFLLDLAKASYRHKREVGDS